MANWGLSNQSVTDATFIQNLLWCIKSSLLLAGWTVQGSSNGTPGGVQGSTWNNNVNQDYFTFAAAGTSGAWVRLREPSGAGGREYILMRGSASRGIIIKYSRSSGFTSGAGPTTCPTTVAGGDGVVWIGSATSNGVATPGYSATGSGSNSYDQAVTTAAQQYSLDSITSGYMTCVASDTPVNGVYGWWCLSYGFGGSGFTSLLFTEGVDTICAIPTDYDPSIRQYGAPGSNNWRAYNAPAGYLAQYWDGYPSPWALNPTNAIYRTNTSAMSSAYYTFNNAGAIAYPAWPMGDATGTSALSPYNRKSLFMPMLVATSNNTGQVPKGFTSGVRNTKGSFNFGDTFDLTTANPYFLFANNYVATGGTYYASIWVVIPWLTNVTPLI